MTEIILILRFFMQFVGVYFEERAAAQKRKENYQLSETEILNITSSSLQKMRELAQKESLEAGKVESLIEDDLSEESSEHTDGSASRIVLESDESGRLHKVHRTIQSDEAQNPKNTKRSNNQN
jgi:hypothetical protein